MREKSKPKLSADEKNLTRRYLIWCYKTTKEDIDRIERYYTQLAVDDFVLKELQTETKSRAGHVSTQYRQYLKDFEGYINTKKVNVDKKKFNNVTRQTLNDNYLYLQNRFKALKKAITYFLGKTELSRIRDMYEEEMTCRILEAEGH